MTELTYKEKFAEWFDEQRKNGMIDFKPSFNHEAIAEKFGATLHRDEYGMFSYLDFSETPYKTIMHPEVQEHIYEGLYKFVTAKSVRISDTTDKWGDVLDPNHPDWMTLDEKIEHVKLMRAHDLGTMSHWETPMVLEGHIEPTPGKTLEDYQRDWDDRMQAYEEKFGSPWPHPREDPDWDLDADLHITEIVEP